MYVFSFAFWIAMAGLALVHGLVGRRTQRWLLLAASIAVYASFNPRLLVLLGYVIATTWAGIRSTHYTDDRSMLRFIRVVATLSAFLPLLLARLSDDAVRFAGGLIGRFSADQGDWTIDTLIPVGVAFYTLQAVDAMFKAHRRGETPSFLDHALLVSFFPTIFVGPVQQYERLMPQLRRRRAMTSEDIDAAALAILFGLFWKLVVADNVLPIADAVFAAPGSATGPEVVAAAAAFSVGIIADLAGYTAMVVGLARLFGIRIRSDNVRQPYLARSPIDFWDRWLTPVTDWMLRYIFLPLRGASPSTLRTLSALAVTFFAGGLWYGERPTILVWAALHFVAVVVQLGVQRRRDPGTSVVVNACKLLATFGFVSYTWIWFRAASLADALRLHRQLLTPELTSFARGAVFTTVLFLALLWVSDRLLVELKREANGHIWSQSLLRGAAFAALVASIFVLATADLHDSILGAQ